MPDWMSFHSSPPPPTALQFESDPPGADVRTAQGQTCLTPCSLTVPPENQSVSFAKNGYLPQTVQVTVRMPEHGMFENPPPDIQPNPVAVVLQPAPPPHRMAPRPKPHKTAAQGQRAAPRHRRPVARRSRRHRRGNSDSASWVSRSGARCPGPSGLYPAQLLII